MSHEHEIVHTTKRVDHLFSTATRRDDRLLDYDPSKAPKGLLDVEHEAIRAFIRSGRYPQPVRERSKFVRYAAVSLAAWTGFLTLDAFEVWPVLSFILFMTGVVAAIAASGTLSWLRLHDDPLTRSGMLLGVTAAVVARKPTTVEGERAIKQYRKAYTAANTIRSMSAWTSGDLSRHGLAVDLDDLLWSIRRRTHAVLDIQDLITLALPKAEEDALTAQMGRVVESTGGLLASLYRYRDEAAALSAEIDALRAVEAVESRLAGILDAVAETAGDSYRVEDIERRTAEIAARREVLAVLRSEIMGVAVTS